MARYSKNNSNFIIRKKHQSIEGGTILERDWSTLGERHVIESGKRKVYGDSGFLFTDSTRPGLKKRNRSGEWDAPLTLDDLTDTVNDSVNIIQLPKSNDLRDYAYWGSAKELVRSSIENIVKWFPGRIWAEDTPIYIPNNSGSGMNAIADIIGDGHGNYIIKTVKENEVIIDNGDCITFGDEPKPCITFSCDTDIIEDNSNIGLWLLYNPFQINLINTSLQFTKYDNQLRALAVNWKQYLLNGYNIIDYKVWIKPINECDNDYTILYDITITYKKNKEKLTGHIYGLKLGKNILWCTTLRRLDIRPNLRIIEDYFKNLQGFDKVLLTRETYPLYTPKLITPVEISYNYYVYVAKSYQWPSTDYCVDVDGIGFELYIDKLYKLSELIDNLWTNNLWGNMTHESIKNFDWTYEREDEENNDNVEGSNRMEQVLQIMGAHFDDIKRWVDNIKHKNTITYDGNNNLPNAELSDKCNSLGWETYSTKLNPNDNLYLDNGNIFTNNIKWFNNLNPNQVNQNYIDNEFMRRLTLSAKEIFKTKGTKQCIEMVFGMFGIGESDFEIIERYYTIEQLYKKDDIYRFYRKNDIVNSEITEEEIYKTYELQSSNSLQEWLQGKIEENGGNPILGDELPKHIKFGTDPDFIHYDLDDTMTVGQFLAYANECKSIVHNYDDVFSGVPLKIVTIDGIEYIAPYFSQDKIYDGDVQFETNGGWGKHIEDFNQLDNVINQNYNYLETLPYIEIVQNCSQLLNVNPYTIGKKTIFYVMNTSDYVEFNENIPDGLSHYFKLINPINPNLKSSWKTIPIIDLVEEDYNNLCNSDGAFQGVTYIDYLEAIYHDGLIQDNLANNPHCGYAKYDLGTEYLEYCKQPFKYSIDKYLIMEYDILEALKLLTFKINTHYGEKMINLVNNPENNVNYYLPSKMVILKNKINNEYYKEYLNNVILKYVLQVIPSTSILVLENWLQQRTTCVVKIQYVDEDNNIIDSTTVDTTIYTNTSFQFDNQIIEKECYSVLGWKYSGTNNTLNNNYYINNVKGDTYIDIVYKSLQHKISIQSEPQDLPGFNVNWARSEDNCGNDISLQIINNNECYTYVKLTDGNTEYHPVSIDPVTKYNITITEDTLFTAVFELNKYYITVQQPYDTITDSVINTDNNIFTISYNIIDNKSDEIRLINGNSHINEIPCGSTINVDINTETNDYIFKEWEINNNSNVTISKNNITIENIQNSNYILTPKYELKVVNITINHIDENGNEIHDSEFIDDIHKYETIDPRLDISCYDPIYWKYSNTTEQYKNFNIEITEDITIDVIYRSLSHELDIEAIDTNTNEEIDNITFIIETTPDTCGNEGTIEIQNNNECYNYVGIYNNNGELISESNPIQFNISPMEESETVIYTAKFEKIKHIVTINKPNDVNSNITVYYTKQNNNETSFNLVNNEHIINNIPCGSSIQIKVDETITDYKFDQWIVENSDNNININKNIININEVVTSDYILTPKYKINQVIITVNYIDENGNELQNSISDTIDKFNEYTINIPNIGCHDYSKSINHKTGVTIQNNYINSVTENTEIDVIYKRKQYTVTINPAIDENKNTINSNDIKINYRIS